MTIEHLYRDIRSLRIYEGASEVQLLILGKHALKSLTRRHAMAQHPSAQTDRFVHDRLPPRPISGPSCATTCPSCRQLPAQLNVVQALFDRALANGHADRPFLRSDERTLSYAQTRAEVDRFAQRAGSRWACNPATVCCCAAATRSRWRWPGWRWCRVV